MKSGYDSVEFTENALKQQLDERDISYTSTSQNVGYNFDDASNKLIEAICAISLFTFNGFKPFNFLISFVTS
jgi:hypothetical protein